MSHLKDKYNKSSEHDYCSCGSPLPPDYKSYLCQRCINSNLGHDLEIPDCEDY